MEWAFHPFSLSFSFDGKWGSDGDGRGFSGALLVDGTLEGCGCGYLRGSGGSLRDSNKRYVAVGIFRESVQETRKFNGGGVRRG